MTPNKDEFADVNIKFVTLEGVPGRVPSSPRKWVRKWAGLSGVAPLVGMRGLGKILGKSTRALGNTD
ncbi:hypothetical protein M0802_013033 [Mischocyttarus mexicanus]|nr:hypothetical protein M0802_013033 [Mischocyttarus mexicanus]